MADEAWSYQRADGDPRDLVPGLVRSGVDGAAAVEGHGALQGGRAHAFRDLDRAAQRGGVDAGLSGLLDDRRRP